MLVQINTILDKERKLYDLFFSFPDNPLALEISQNAAG